MFKKKIRSFFIDLYLGLLSKSQKWNLVRKQTSPKFFLYQLQHLLLFINYFIILPDVYVTKKNYEPLPNQCCFSADTRFSLER